MQPQLIAGRYQVLRAIGRGGMGTVWLCRDEVLGREVAVKQIGALPGESATETKRAMREARSAASINHPNAVAVYDVVDHDGRPWLVMEYVEGETLADEIARDGRLSPQRVADLGAQLAGALARAHQRRIVHRDIKPGNVLIDKAGRPKISDFGIARGHGDEQLTQVGFITGTPGYLSPELARGGDPHPASDVWALGATLYAAVEGQPPYEPRSNPIALLRAIAVERPRKMTHAGALAPAIEAMMHEDPACRWDMATSARRLGGIARAGAPAYLRRADPAATKVIGAPLVESTQPLEPTQRLAPVVPVAVAAPVAAALVVPRPVVTAPVAEVPLASAPVAAEPVTAGPPVPRPPLAADPVAAKPAAAKPAAVSPVAAKPVAAKASVAAEPSVAKAPVVEGPVPPSQDGGSGRPWKPFVLVALLVGVLTAVYLMSQTLDPRTTTHPGSTQTSPQSTSAPAAAPKTTEPSPATTSAPTAVSAPTGKEADKQLADFVDSYYSDVAHKDKRDHTWAQLTRRMQATTAQGRGGYESWWSAFESVDVNGTRANASAMTATVDLTYKRTNGTESRETDRLTFVRRSGVWLIDTYKANG
jgi:serine/threonine protein kinase